MKYILKLFFVFACFGSFILPGNVFARENITDWYIKSLDTNITVNKDSSLDITENILADCGDLPNKHGIYRVVPYQTSGSDGAVFNTPISLTSITDQNNQKYKYSTTNDRSDHTVSWKIGDTDKTVSGENTYIIKYHVENAIRNGNSNFDELYWNLNGSFWDLEIDSFKATVNFPDEFDNSKSEVNMYSGSFGEKDSQNIKYSWHSKNVFIAESTQMLPEKFGITASITSPKGIFVPYSPPFLIKYAWVFYSLIPILALYLCFALWKKYGKDPKINPTIAPEFEIPEKLSCIDMGMVDSDGSMSNKYLTAGIVALAVKGYIKIEEVPKKSILSSKDYIIHSLDDPKGELSASERKLYERLLDGAESIKISSLKNKFYKDIPAIESSSMDYLTDKGWLISSSRGWMIAFAIFGIICGFFAIVSFSIDVRLGLALLVSAIIIIIFSPLMRRRSESGALLSRRIRGFEMYMKKAEVYRQQWMEKQNMFEEFLPYAIVFGIAKEWVKKLHDIYGEEYFRSYVPIWYYGYSGGFDFNSFGDSISSMSSEIGSTLSSSPSSSGSGGGGFSGGGGGGGGGGGW